MSSNNPNRVYLDTETTGLHPEEGDEILSLTIVDANGRLLFDERFKPKHKKEWPEAQAVNHISPDDVEHLTTIDAYMEQICRILDRIADEIVGYQSTSRHQFEQHFIFVQQLTLPIVETKGFTTVFDNQSGEHCGRQEVSCRIHRGGVLPVVQISDSAQPCPPPRTSSSAHARYTPFYQIFFFTS